MDDGFTGINIPQACAQQQNFNDIMGSVIFGIESDMIYIMTTLRRNWASPNAVEFGKNTTALISACLKNIGTFTDRIIKDVFESIDAYVRATGANCPSVISETDWKNYESVIVTYTMDAANHNGQTGMNIGLVTDLKDNELTKIKNKALSKLESLPANICIYDEAGVQQEAYTKRKQNIGKLVEHLLTTIEKDIAGYIETEKNNLLLAKQQVVQNMNGSSTTNA